LKRLGKDVERRAVVEAYLAYDSAKKEYARPDTGGWDWSSADAIDAALKAAGSPSNRPKHGVLAGYLKWIRVEVTIDDLRQCAIESRISQKFHPTIRDLGRLADNGLLVGQAPDGRREWFDAIQAGGSLREDEPLILRPATRGELPANWYLEDGSGRAIALVANQERFTSGQVLAYAYLGIEPDQSSSFMREMPPELLRAPGSGM